MLAIRSFAAPARQQYFRASARAVASTSVQVCIPRCSVQDRLTQRRFALLINCALQSRRHYAKDSSEKVAKFHGQKGSDVSSLASSLSDKEVGTQEGGTIF
jgi:hypothetical protein